MDAAAEQQMSTKRRHTTTAAASDKERSNNRRQIPLEIVETILMLLPLKSLCRFSRVSKSWKSLIFAPNFMKQRAAICDNRLFMIPNRDSEITDASSCSLSSISSGNADATPIIFPIKGKPILRASCGELCCVEVNDSLYLWNPSLDIYKKLPKPLIPYYESDGLGFFHAEYISGLGYDSVNDDFKIFRLEQSIFHHESELYSLRSDSWRMIDHGSELDSLRSESWRMIDDKPIVSTFQHKKCVFVGGAFHWWHRINIYSFDLATEKYGYIEPPLDEEALLYEPGSLELSVLKGKLCASSCLPSQEFHLVIWVMEEYVNEKSWTKKFVIENGDGIPLDPDYVGLFSDFLPIEATPLYVFDNGEILFKVRTDFRKDYALFMYKGDETTPWKMICSGICHGFVYEESLFFTSQVCKVELEDLSFEF